MEQNLELVAVAETWDNGKQSPLAHHRSRNGR
jgi:hypothetical protein